MAYLPPHAIDEFQVLWKQHYGVVLSRDEAVDRAHQVFALVRMLVEASPSANPAGLDPTGIVRHAHSDQEVVSTAGETSRPASSA
ncbi:MAG: hypothetical protein JOZ57_03670 [Abitibacteriaceae bacterium]|nr:hypothetical protein [Abditibacteriaceae bacterium]